MSAADSAAGSLSTLASKISSFRMPTIAAPGPTPPPIPAHLHGGIAIRPHIGLIGEAGPEAIVPLGKALGGKLGGLLGGVTVNAPITINGAAGEHGSLSAVLQGHAREIAPQVQQVLQIEAEQAAVV
jgi:hypothetical protein